jgi:sulfur transfer protein SufE
MDSYHDFIDWLKRFECGRQLQSLLEVTVPNGEETVFLKTEPENNKPIVFIAHNQSFIVNGTINFFYENPNVQFTVRKISDITQKIIQMMTISPSELTALVDLKTCSWN